MYGCESWTIKKAEHWKMDAFKLWCWRRLLRVPWTARRSNRSILKEINLEYSLEGLMLKLKLQYFGHLMQRTNSLDKTLMLGRLKAGGKRDNRGWDELNEHAFEQTPGDSQGQRSLTCSSPWGCRVRHDLVTEEQQQAYAESQPLLGLTQYQAHGKCNKHLAYCLSESIKR